MRDVNNCVYHDKEKPRGARLFFACISVLLVAAPSRSRAEPTIRRLELVTVTDTTAVLTWETNQPADTIVNFGEQKDQLNLPASDANQNPVRFHYCQLSGLKPGTKYYYVCRSGSAQANIDSLSPGEFTTLIRPAGKELFAFATLTDTHVGRDVVARVVISGEVVREGVRWRDPKTPFWQLALNSAIDDINARNLSFTIIKGDIVHLGSEQELTAAKSMLDRLTQPYYIVAGNHDYRGEKKVDAGPKRLMHTFGLSEPWYSFDHNGMHFIVLDTEAFNCIAARHPVVYQTMNRQLAWLAEDLQAHRRQWTFVFVHRPIPPKVASGSGGPISEGLFQAQRDAAQTIFGSRAAEHLDTASGRGRCLPEDNTRRLVQLFREHGRIAGVFAGHLHRNYVGYWPEQTGNLPYVETNATYEYPCGYAVTRVFSGGYMHNYYKCRNQQCLEWSALTQDAFSGIALMSKVGRLTDRNFVVHFDKLDLQPIKETGK